MVFSVMDYTFFFSLRQSNQLDVFPFFKLLKGQSPKMNNSNKINLN